MVISIQELRKMERQREQAEQNVQRPQRPKRFPWQSQAKNETSDESVLRFARFFYEQ